MEQRAPTPVERPGTSGTAGAIGPVCFVRWSLQPTLEEVRTARDAVLEARRANGRPIGLFAYIDAETRRPPVNVTLEMARAVPVLDRAIEYGVAVLAGTSTRARLVHGSALAISATFRAAWDVERDVDAGLRRMAKRYRLDFETLRREAIARGFVPAPAAP